MKLAILFRFCTICYLFKRTGAYRLFKATRYHKIYLFVAIFLFYIPSLNSNNGAALRIFLERVGVLAIKLGQMISTQQSILPKEIAEEIVALQTKARPINHQQAISIIVNDLTVNGINLDELDLQIDDIPLASASIAQVHSATIVKQGKIHNIVIKFLRPNLKKQIDLDLMIINKLAYFINDIYPQSGRLRLQETIRELETILYQEINLQVEASHLSLFADTWNETGQIYVPKLYPELSTPSTMVMERVYGYNLYQIMNMDDKHINYRYLAELGVSVFLKQVFRDNFFHADMHPGNILFDVKNPQQPHYIALDFGNVGSLTSGDKKYLAENLLAFFSRDYRKVAQLHVDSGWSRGAVDINNFERAIRNAIDHIFNKPLKDISFADVLQTLFKVAHSFNMEVQPGLIMLQRTLLYVEGMGRTLYKDLNLWETAKPHIEKWVAEQYQIGKPLIEVGKNLGPILETVNKLPDTTYMFMNNQQRIITLLEQQQIRSVNSLNKIKIIIFWLSTWNFLFLTIVGIKLGLGWINIIPFLVFIVSLVISIIRLF